MASLLFSLSSFYLLLKPMHQLFIKLFFCLTFERAEYQNFISGTNSINLQAQNEWKQKKTTKQYLYCVHGIPIRRIH